MPKVKGLILLSMKNKIIWILVTIVMATLLGLIITQYFWIKNAFEVKENLFRLQVNAALTSIVKSLEQEETVEKLVYELNAIPNSPNN